MDAESRAEALVRQGIDQARSGKHLKAAELFLEALEKEPGHPVVSYNLALEYISLGEPVLALGYLNTALKSDPENPDYWCEKGIAQYRTGDSIAAEESYDRALSLGGESSRLWNGLGVLRFITGRYGEAEEFFSRAVKQDPANEDGWFNLADTLDELGNKHSARQAREEYEKLSRREKP
jgi:tetratricopeptide (TPR) repeat protein